MNQEQAISLLRTILQIGAGFVIGKGWVTAEQASVLTGAIVAIVVTGWSIYTRRKAGLIASAAAISQVERIVTTSKTIADAVPNPKVIAR